MSLLVQNLQDLVQSCKEEGGKGAKKDLGRRRTWGLDEAGGGTVVYFPFVKNSLINLFLRY